MIVNAAAKQTTSTIDVEAIRQQFPILQQSIYQKPLAYLDSAASSQKPQCVVDAIAHYYQHNHANVHRGVHTLSVRATDAFESSRETMRSFINAKSIKEVIFVRNGTEAINLVAATFAEQHLQAGDEILLTQMEHHANIVPWKMQCERVGATLKVIPITENGELDLTTLSDLLTDKVKLVALTHVSNVLGTVNPVKQVIDAAHARDIPVLLDGAQAGPHLKIDVQALDVDFYTLSGHKMYGPTGISILYGKEKWLSTLPPYQGGGDMIQQVSFDKITYNDLPNKYEAGTPNIAGAIGLAAAAKWIESIGHQAIAQHEKSLLDYAMTQLTELKDYQVFGTALTKASVLAFNHQRIHAHDVGTIMDCEGIAIRTGHHCAMPLMDFYQVPAMARASFAVFNTMDEVDRFIAACIKVNEVMG